MGQDEPFGDLPGFPGPVSPIHPSPAVSPQPRRPRTSASAVGSPGTSVFTPTQPPSSMSPERTAVSLGAKGSPGDVAQKAPNASVQRAPKKLRLT